MVPTWQSSRETCLKRLVQRLQWLRRLAKRAGLITSDSGVVFSVEANLADVTESDSLLVPGAASATSLRERLEWVRAIHESSNWTTSVCTGSLIFGAAGLLAGVRATSHWAALDRLVEHGGLPVSSRVVEDGKIMTCAGVAAGIDMSLTLAARIGGENLAKTLQLAMEYDPALPFNCGHPFKSDPARTDALRTRMMRSFERLPGETA